MQPTEKLHIIDNACVMGVSGAVGLGQLYLDKISTLWLQELKEGALTVADTRRVVSNAIFAEVSTEVAKARNIIPTQDHLKLVGTHSLLALPAGPERRPTLVQIDFRGATEAASEDLPIVSAGSGQSIADPFLAFLRRVFWRGRVPTIQDGIFVITWALQHAIYDSANRFSQPITIAVLDRNGARHLPLGEVADHLQHVDDFERNMPNSRTRSVPEPPTPPSP